jgi:hypothetical protein
MSDEFVCWPDRLYRHITGAHLSRYLTEFDFRDNGRDIYDTEGATDLLCDTQGKRLMYWQPNGSAHI